MKTVFEGGQSVVKVTGRREPRNKELLFDGKEPVCVCALAREMDTKYWLESNIGDKWKNW